MSAAIHKGMFQFRANPALLEDAHRVAERRSMTVSELMRHALREQIEKAAQA